MTGVWIPSSQSQTGSGQELHAHSSTLLDGQHTGVIGAQASLPAKTTFSFPKIKIQETTITKKIAPLKIIFI
jgi:hypothetical protein